MLKCLKCGADLHEDQKVCIVCGTRTIRGDGFDYGNKGPWRPTRNMLIGAGVVVLALIIVMIANSMKVTPPEVVAKEWFSALSERRPRVAASYVTPALENDLSDDNNDLRGLSDEYYVEVTENQAKYTISQPETTGNNANVKIKLSYPGGGTKQVNIGMIKDGRRWLVNDVM